MTTEVEAKKLTDGEVEALRVLVLGMASRASTTDYRPDEYVRCVNSGVATRLVKAGLAEDVPNWNAVEITDAGRAALQELA